MGDNHQKDYIRKFFAKNETPKEWKMKFILFIYLFPKSVYEIGFAFRFRKTSFLTQLRWKEIKVYFSKLWKS